MNKKVKDFLNALDVSYIDSGDGTHAEVVASAIYKMLKDTPTATTAYVCEAVIGSATSAPVWRIMRITTAGTTELIEWAGTGTFDQIADNRATLGYS